jgi:uncharacterized membrane-anchored protein
MSKVDEFWQTEKEQRLRDRESLLADMQAARATKDALALQQEQVMTIMVIALAVAMVMVVAVVVVIAISRGSGARVD